MNEDHTNHMMSVIEESNKRLIEKYTAGQLEHGGRLWEKSPKLLANEMFNEAVDQIVYGATLKKMVDALAEENADLKRRLAIKESFIVPPIED